MVVQERLAEVFEPQQARVLAEVMVETYDDLVKRVGESPVETRLVGDFNELKGIVRELATAQQRTEEHVRGLTLRMDALAAAQHELTTQVQELVTWQRGEAGRRDRVGESPVETRW
jgi:undecaprenyl pyrophosphate synthase